MRFCPDCEAKLKKQGSSLLCPKCGYQESEEGKKLKKDEEYESELDILAESEEQETLPTITKECEKCGNNEAIWWMLQTRSADEPTTQFFRCTKCKHTWRDYS